MDDQGKDDWSLTVVAMLASYRAFSSGEGEFQTYRVELAFAQVNSCLPR